MTVKTWAKRVSTNSMLVGFDPMLILSILSVLLPIIAKWCGGDKNPAKLREKAAKALAKHDMPTARHRRIMAKNGMDNKLDQDHLWLAILADAVTRPDKDFVVGCSSINYSTIEG